LITIAKTPAFAASTLVNQNDINRKENNPINSQHINKVIKLLALTSHNIEQVNACNHR
jgi:hypothetical protein